jgi:quercetin dioxygenase-like cupin family protein
MAAASVLKKFFRTKQEAIADINAEGFWPISWVDGPGETYAPHYHRGDERLYLVSGSMEFEDVGEGKVYRLEPGDKLSLPAGTVHRTVTREGAAYIIAVRDLVPLAESALPADTKP